MPIVSSGSIRMGADIGVELGNTSTSMISIGATAPRALAGVTSGAIRVAADFYGKSATAGAIITTNLFYVESALPFSSANVPGFNDQGCWGCSGQDGTGNEFQAFAFGYPSSPNNFLSIDELCGLSGGLQSHTAWSKLDKIEAYSGSGGTGSLIQSVSKTSFVGYPSAYNAGATAYYVPFSSAVINAGVAVAGSLKWYFNP
jgi:hypothetical protein